jgi:hypothetical protein
MIRRVQCATCPTFGLVHRLGTNESEGICPIQKEKTKSKGCPHQRKKGRRGLLSMNDDGTGKERPVRQRGCACSAGAQPRHSGVQSRRVGWRLALRGASFRLDVSTHVSDDAQRAWLQNMTFFADWIGGKLISTRKYVLL